MKPTPIERLESIYRHANQVCDPISFLGREHNLLHAIAVYLIDRDKPEIEETEDD